LVFDQNVDNSVHLGVNQRSSRYYVNVDNYVDKWVNQCG